MAWHGAGRETLDQAQVVGTIDIDIVEPERVDNEVTMIRREAKLIGIGNDLVTERGTGMRIDDE